MTAIADVSGDLSALWPWQVWTCITCGVAFVWLVWSVLRAPIEDAEPDGLDILDGAQHPNALLDCYTAGGHYYRLDADRRGYTCAGCGQHVDRAGVA